VGWSKLASTMRPWCLPTEQQEELPLPTFRLCSNPTPQPEHSVLPPQVSWPSHPYGRTAPTHIWKLGITHVLNAAHGRQHCLGSHTFYGSTVDYHGVPADDSPSFDISLYFYSSADYIQDALNTADGRILVHCAVGVSRSASLVLAYLMIHHHYSLLDAITKVKEHRWIFPNTGFLKQLRALDKKLHTKKQEKR
uniref:Dual specificity protein phosphatase n=1 Tax=Oncorhynchus mykiss TaxID=8022 RepID=A0A8C7TC00_ONCMY